MSTVWTTDIYINLDLLFTPGTLIGAGHGGLPLLDRSLNGAECNFLIRRDWNVRSTGVFKVTLSAFPDSCSFPSDGNIVAAWTGVSRLRDDLNLAYALTDEPSISWTKAPG